MSLGVGEVVWAGSNSDVAINSAGVPIFAEPGADISANSSNATAYYQDLADVAVNGQNAELIECADISFSGGPAGGC